MARFAAVAGELGHVALSQVAGEGRVDENGRVRVAVRIHEARGDDMTGGVDDGPDICLRDVREVGHGRDAVARHADIGGAAGCAAAVDDRAAADQGVEGHVAIVAGVVGAVMS